MVMKQNPLFALIVIVLLSLISTFLYAVPVAFPGAEGSGRFATGGRGGDVYEVTNLTNSGPGSIVDAVSSDNRTIVFRVSGTIELGDVILRPKSNTTIAGQTAPGDGICLMGRIHIGDVSNVVIRYLRVRVDAGGANADGDAIDIDQGQNIIIDHVSASYSRDETISCQDGSDNVTVQWCILSEALNLINENHSYGSLVRGEYGEEKTYHHNLYAHNRGRNPRPGNYTDIGSDPEGLHFDFRNNVVYNWMGSTAGYNDDGSTVSRYNFIGNAYFTGPDSTGSIAFRESSEVSYGYFADNSLNDVVPSDPWNLINLNMSSTEITNYKARSSILSMEPVTTTSPAQAKIDVLADAGASFPSRDMVDIRIINDVFNGTGNIIENTSDLADPWPTLDSLPAPTDTDHDGMPDVWEIANGLNETNPADRNNYDLHLEYTNLEVYLNSLVADDLEAPAAPSGLAADAGNGLVELDWGDNTDDDLAGYNIYRSTTSGTDYIKLNTTTVSSSDFTDNTAANGITYFYVAGAVDHSSNESDFSNEVFATPIDLNYYGDANGDLYVDITDLPDFFAVWLESDCLVTSGWDINDDCVVNDDEFSLLASHWMLDTVAPDAPANLSADSGEGEVLLDWDDNSESDLAGYNIYRSVSGGSFDLLNTTLLSTSDYTDADVINGTTYAYIVTAVDEALNESDDSNETAATPGAPTPTITIQEYDTGFCSSVDDADIEEITGDDHQGYTGDGYTNTENATGVGINYSVNILASGTYSFVFRYAGISSRPADLIIDSVMEVEDIAFPSTGDWEVWNTTSAVNVTLSAGVKTIRLEATSSSGLANIDYMQVSGTNLKPAACP